MSLAEIAINVGILLGFTACYLFKDLKEGMNWKFMLGLGIALPGIRVKDHFRQSLSCTATVKPHSC